MTGPDYLSALTVGQHQKIRRVSGDLGKTGPSTPEGHRKHHVNKTRGYNKISPSPHCAQGRERYTSLSSLVGYSYNRLSGYLLLHLEAGRNRLECSLKAILVVSGIF